jgi:hypothetical protein
MSSESDLIFDGIYVAGMSLVAGMNIWAVYSKYRQCVKHLEERANPAVLRQDIADITFAAMIAIAWAVLSGVSIGAVTKELKWTAAGLLTGMFGVLGLLSAPSLRRLVQRRSQD